MVKKCLKTTVYAIDRNERGSRDVPGEDNIHDVDDTIEKSHGRQFINFSAAKGRQQMAAASNKTKQRSNKLLNMIQVITFLRFPACDSKLFIDTRSL